MYYLNHFDTYEELKAAIEAFIHYYNMEDVFRRKQEAKSALAKAQTTRDKRSRKPVLDMSLPYHVWNLWTTFQPKQSRPATFWPRAPRIRQILRPIGDHVFGPFPKVAHPLHEKSAKDGALCKRDKKRTGILSDSGILWSR